LAQRLGEQFHGVLGLRGEPGRVGRLGQQLDPIHPGKSFGLQNLATQL
jgi:hypothetical protein